MKKPLRAGMAACGGVSNLTLDAAPRSADFDVVAIQDVDEAALRAVGDRYRIERRHTRFEDLLTADLDFLVINSPNHLHLEHVSRAAAAGKPCLVQKPMAPTLAEAERMVEAARAHGIKLGVTMFELGHPLHHEMRAMVQSGWLGTPVVVQTLNAHDAFLTAPPPADDWRRDPRKVGGGAFIQLAVHHLNLASWILDQRLVEIAALGTRGLTVFEDETTLATAVFSRGAVASFAATYAASASSFSILGTEGAVHLFPDHLVLKGRRPLVGRLVTYPEPGRECAVALAALGDALAQLARPLEMHGRFARWIASGEPFPCPAERGLEDMKALDAAYRSLAEERAVRIP